MKKIKLSIIVLSLALFASINVALAQQDGQASAHTVTLGLGQNALIGVTGDISLTTGGALTAGDSISLVAENSETRIRLTSGTTTGQSRTVSVQSDIDIVASLNCHLFITPMAPNASFRNTATLENLQASTAGVTTVYGTLSGRQELSNSSVSIISKIAGACWTGNADGDGYGVKYDMTVDAGQTLTPGSVVITYTLSDPV